ncbi:MAG TPA: glycosyltransferase family A protein [Verrucomicrobiae bacterium]|nr:glycosyltransferase family A protein [Verrucomicrobiae bacterium]
MTETINTEALAPNISLGIIAWNEADSIGACLESVFRQSLFSKLSDRKLTCEIICLANGCTDDTSNVAQKSFDAHASVHPFKNSFTCRLINLAERGKLNAWNVFVHKLSAPKAQFLCLMDADILIHHPDTLWNMLAVLLQHPQAVIAVDRPLKDISFKAHPSVLERISLATSAMTQARTAQVTGQLYFIRATAARNIYLPRDLAACEDGFIKTVICTDFLTRPASPARIMQADDASHVFEAYSSIGDILKNQKRQMIGQTIVHVLVDKYVKGMNLSQRTHFGEITGDSERTDPTWLKRLIHEHIRMTHHCWQLFPGILRSRFRPLARMRGIRRALYLPVAIIGFFVTLISCWRAFRALKQGCTAYWPDTKSLHLAQHLSPTVPPPTVLPT